MTAIVMLDYPLSAFPDYVYEPKRVESMRTKINCSRLATVVALCLSPLLAQGADLQQQQLLQLQEAISQQQRQLEQQAEQIKKQADMLRQLQQQLEALQTKPVSPTGTLLTAPSSAPLQASALPPAAVTSGNDKIKLSLSGQVNRAVNVINDGGRTRLYHIDNDADNTYINLQGTAAVRSDLTLAARLAFAMTADESSVVSQTNQTPGNYLNAKWAEVSLESKAFGKLSLGKGSTATDNTAAVDLSKTDIVLYSSISDIAGGILFRQNNGAYSSTTVANAFNVLNGLGKASRLRYDTPSLIGFILSGSLVSDQRSDLALSWGGEGYGFQAAGGFGLANPKLDGAGLQYDGSFSLLHTTSGLNLTLAAGLLEQKQRNDGTNLYAKLGWLANLTSLGSTAFGIDYTRSRDMAATGDRGYSVGGAVVQSFEKYATELYLQYRIFSLDRTADIPVSDINIGTFGARVKF